MRLCTDPVDDLAVRIQALHKLHDSLDLSVVRVEIVVVDVQLRAGV
jgi:hypothetical protein